ncbi:hypothetical protein [Clostridium sp. UBA1652]|uniref:hypothetical protein n=1 Tax=Clostridium sp. UBA1652 TaxID=1946348 RepID=UPI002579F2E8|nr:hypothetical protein [Clostridium sp. UBA1652]
MDRNDFVKMFWRTDVEMFLSKWFIALDFISESKFDKSKIGIKNNNKLAKELSSFELSLIMYDIIDNPIEQLISAALVISIYSSLEKCILTLIPAIENKSKIKYSKYNDNQKDRRLSGMDKLIKYIEDFSNIKFDKELSKDIDVIRVLRNEIVHNSSRISNRKMEFYRSNKHIFNKYAVIEKGTDGEVFLGEDLKHINNIFKTIEPFLMNTLDQEIFI